ncbi:IQ domain-containing protein C isoform X2 [Carettochelys insculpta]|uniref:IQ domain-containing protein C isoform X2 n=1 Tax=Carettochelys insculpta TaxID=44489 RepID=UPI003EB9C0F3
MAPEEERLVRVVTRLQACVRGYLVRKRFQNLQEEYENTVEEIEGDLSQLQWKGGFIPIPVFSQKIGSIQFKKQMKAKQLTDQEPGSKDDDNIDKGLQNLCPPESVEPEKDCNSRSYMKPTTQLQELPFKNTQQELPQTLPDLQCYRNHLAMELLWLQQAIVSRKKYLILKQRLGTPER